MVAEKHRLEILEDDVVLDQVPPEIAEIIVGENCQAVIFETSSSKRIPLHITVKQGAKLNYFTYNNGSNVCHHEVHADVYQNGILKIYHAATSNQNMNLTTKVYLKQPDATCNIMNVLLFLEDAILDSHIELFHETNHTNSTLANYAIAKGHAQLLLSNNATIHKNAKGSIAIQKAKGLTLNTKAKIKAMPNLFIDEYDVIANHAAAIGSMNKEDLFYLMSRGLTAQEASKIIVMGFIQPLLNDITNEPFKQKIKQEFAFKLSI